jgi:protein disulfide-isomerase A3
VNDKLERSKYRYPSKTLVNKNKPLLDFIRIKSLPLAGELTHKNQVVYDGLNKPVVTVFSQVDLVRNIKGYNYLANRVRKIAKQYENKIVFNIASIDTFSYLMEHHFGFESVSNKQTYVGLRENNLYYQMNDKFSVENLMTFIKQFQAGELEGRESVS